MTSFVPKQCLPPDPAYFTQLAGDSTEQVARRLLEFIPSITPGSVIHDNACGAGAMSAAIMSSGVEDVSILATDMVPQLIEQLKQKAAENNWPVRAEVMPSEALTSPDATVTHSFTNLGIMVMDGDVEAAKHVYRTLKPGGLAVFSIWDKPLPVQLVTAAHQATRPNDLEVPPVIKRGKFNDNDLREVLKRAGFKAESTVFKRTYADLEVKDLRFWASALWSFVGSPVGGWTNEDEERWDDAIEVIMGETLSYEGYKKQEHGRATFTMPAHVAITRKQ